jgi:RNA polymerase sigma-70 factor, ECF subfamily
VRAIILPRFLVRRPWRKRWPQPSRTWNSPSEPPHARQLLELRSRIDRTLSALYDRYSGLVFSVAKRIVPRTGEAEEILQDVFYQVWRTAERFDQAKGSLVGWLLVAARNRVMSKLRRKSGPAEELV